MRKRIALAVVLLVAVPLVGCQFLRRVWQQSCATINPTPGVVVQVGGGCTGAGDPQPLLEVSPQVVTILSAYAKKGAPAAAFDKCGDICRGFGEESAECDQCRSTVGAAVTQPYFNVCQGTAYQPLPDNMTVQLQVNTNLGMRTSPVMQVPKVRGTVRYDNCGGENVDYVMDERTVQPWATQMVQQGVRQINNLQVVRVGAGAEQPLFQVKDEFKEQAVAGGMTDPLVWGVGISGWLFNNGGGGGIAADGTITPILLPQSTMGAGGGMSFVGQAVQSLKPCRDNNDCLGGTSCAGDYYCRQ